VLAPVGARAQVVTVELSYSNPGARSMGLGGAFVALADDATAAFANPAGLIQLLRTEVSTELRLWSYETPYVAGGRINGTPSGIGLDTEAGLRTGVSSPEFTDLSFLSWVYPKRDWSFALYRHQLVRFESFAQVEGLFSDPPGDGGLTPGFAGTVRDHDQRTFADSDIVSHSFSAAYKVNEDLSLGVGISYFDGSLSVITEEYRPDDEPQGAYFAGNSFLPDSLDLRSTMGADDTDWGLNAGFLWNLTQSWRLGGFYRQGPVFEAEVSIAPGPARSPGPEGSLATGISFPDVWGLGIAFRTADGHLIVAFEWDRVEYSAILDQLDSALFGPGTDLIEPGTELDDGSEFHLGVEYVFVDSNPLLALRLGAWLDPDHRIRNETSPETFTRAFSPRGDDEIHYAAGIGFAFAKIQVDLGVDLSELRDTASLSAIHSF
jgi:long-subunit fatty acid transport protein